MEGDWPHGSLRLRPAKRQEIYSCICRILLYNQVCLSNWPETIECGHRCRPRRIFPMKLRRWVKPILIAALALVFAGLIYERVEEWQDNRRISQIGRSIDIGGRSLNIYCSGEGNPAVIMDSGHALPGYEWAVVQPEIAKLTKACWYDRAGFGWSDRANSLNTVDSMARDLHRLLRAAQIRPPYILVGHSLGGWNVRVFNGLYPGEVAGIVLVDAPSEDTLNRIPNLARRKFPISLPRHALSLVVEGVGQTGVFRLAGFSSCPHPSGFTQEQWAILSALQRNPGPSAPK